MQRFVDFYQYCPQCVHADKNETEDPCEECLFYPVNTDSAKPVNFKEKKEVSVNAQRQ